MRYRPPEKPFSIYTLVYIGTEWILTAQSHPFGIWRVVAYGDLIFLTYAEDTPPTHETYAEAIKKIEEGI